MWKSGSIARCDGPSAKRITVDQRHVRGSLTGLVFYILVMSFEAPCTSIWIM